MTSLFATRLFVSFLVGGLFVSCCSVLAERRGTTIGGMMGGFPSTIAISLLFIGITSNVSNAVSAAEIVAAPLAYSGIYLSVYGYVSRFGFVAGMVTALLTWAGFSILTVMFPPRPFIVACVIFALIFPLSLWLQIQLRKGLSNRFTPGHISRWSIVVRGVFGGTVILLAVLASNMGGPLLGGIMASFPAVYTSTISIAAMTKGIEFSRTLLFSLFLSGQVNCFVYLLAVKFFYPTLGLGIGTIVAFLCSGGSALLLHRYHRRLLPVRV